VNLKRSTTLRYREGTGASSDRHPVWAKLSAGLRCRRGICPLDPPSCPGGHRPGRLGPLRAARQPRYGVRKVKRATRPDDLHRPCGVNHGGVTAKNGESARSADQREPNNHCTANSTTAAAQALIARAAHR
jgi:hypothetical protein